jgi:hypothetical protein
MNLHLSTPRLLGIMFILVVVIAILSVIPLSSLNYTIGESSDDISESMIDFADNPTNVRMSIAGFLMEAVAIVLLTVLLFEVLKNQNIIIARWAFGLWILEAVFLAIRQIFSFSFLTTSQDFVNAGAPDASHFQTLGSIYYELMNFSYDVQMVFYCVGGFLFYYLFFRSNFVPKVLALFGIIAVSLGFIGELLVIFGNDVPLYVFLPILPFELAIGVWLIVKGINSSEIDPGSAKTEMNES